MGAFAKKVSSLMDDQLARMSSEDLDEMGKQYDTQTLMTTLHESRDPKMMESAAKETNQRLQGGVEVYNSVMSGGGIDDLLGQLKILQTKALNVQRHQVRAQRPAAQNLRDMVFDTGPIDDTYNSRNDKPHQLSYNDAFNANTMRQNSASYALFFKYNADALSGAAMRCKHEHVAHLYNLQVLYLLLLMANKCAMVLHTFYFIEFAIKTDSATLSKMEIKSKHNVLRRRLQMNCGDSNDSTALSEMGTNNALRWRQSAGVC